jgi:hypothetical protein
LLKYSSRHAECIAYELLKTSGNFKNHKEVSANEELHRVYDIRSLGSWVGIVLRNIPKTENITEDIKNSFNNTIKSYLKTKNDQTSSIIIQNSHISEIYEIKGKICAIVEISAKEKSEEIGKYLCMNWNQK